MVVNSELYGKVGTTEDTVKPVVITSDTAEGRGNVKRKLGVAREI